MEALGVNLPAFLSQIVNFALLLILLRVLLYRPLLRVMDERRRRIEEGMRSAEDARAQAAASEEEVRRRLEEARKEGQALVAQAQEVANRIQEEARQSARQEAEVVMARARSEIQLERDAAIAEIRRQFGDLTIRAAERVIGQSLDQQSHRRLIDEVLTESGFTEGR